MRKTGRDRNIRTDRQTDTVTPTHTPTLRQITDRQTQRLLYGREKPRNRKWQWSERYEGRYF